MFISAAAATAKHNKEKDLTVKTVVMKIGYRKDSYCSHKQSLNSVMLHYASSLWTQTW